MRPVTDLQLVVPECSRATGGEVSQAVATVVELAAVSRVSIETVRTEADLSRVNCEHDLNINFYN